jgi:hypothetical protein
MALIIKEIIQEIFPSLPEMTAVVEHQEETVCLRVDGFNNKLDEHSSRVYFNSININGMLKVQKSPRWQHVYITFEVSINSIIIKSMYKHRLEHRPV